MVNDTLQWNLGWLTYRTKHILTNQHHHQIDWGIYICCVEHQNQFWGLERKWRVFDIIHQFGTLNLLFIQWRKQLPTTNQIAHISHNSSWKILVPWLEFEMGYPLKFCAKTLKHLWGHIFLYNWSREVKLVSNETLWAALKLLIMLCKLSHLHIYEY
jgi:hypothetical protein